MHNMFNYFNLYLITDISSITFPAKFKTRSITTRRFF